jgi:hypothetical protein
MTTKSFGSSWKKEIALPKKMLMATKNKELLQIDLVV